MDSETKQIGYGIAIVVAIIGLIITAISSFTIIGPDERGIRITLGHIQGDVMESGFNWKPPFITTINTYKVSTQKVTAKLDVFSKDMQSVIITTDIIYNYTPEKVKLLASKYTNDPVKTILGPIAQECFKEVCKDLNSEEIVKNRDQIRVGVNKLYNERLAEYEIFTISSVVVADIELSPQLNDAIEKKMVQDQEAQRATFVKKQKETEAETAKIEAAGLANAVREQAQARADAILMEAKANAEAIKLIGETLKENPLALDELKIKKWNGAFPNFWGNGGQPMNVIFDAKN